MWKNSCKNYERSLLMLSGKTTKSKSVRRFRAVMTLLLLYFKPNPSPVYSCTTATGSGMSERAGLPIAEADADSIRFHIKAVIIK